MVVRIQCIGGAKSIFLKTPTAPLLHSTSCMSPWGFIAASDSGDLSCFGRAVLAAEPTTSARGKHRTGENLVPLKFLVCRCI